MFHFNQPPVKPDNEYYDILGVSKNATEKEIKKAFRQKALITHPDKHNGDDTEFKALNEAYAVLSDPKKKEIYDKYGKDGVKHMSEAGGGPPDHDDLMSMLFPHMQSAKTRHNQHRKSDNIGIEIEVTLEDLYLGKTITHQYVRNLKCDECNGKGTSNEDGIQNCNTCRGSGKHVRTVQMGNMIQQQITTCPSCRGGCKSIKKGYECKKCSGKRIITRTEDLDIPIKPGTMNKDKIFMAGLAHEHPDCLESGDLYVIIKEIPNKYGFIRQNNDLIYEKQIDLVDALCGINFYIHHLDDSYLNATYNGIIKPNQLMKISNKGMPYQNNSGEYGDLYVKFIVNFPDKLNDKAKQFLPKLLPKTKNVFKDNIPNDNDIIENVTLEITKNNNMNYNYTNDDMFEDDNETTEDHPESGMPNCVQQ